MLSSDRVIDLIRAGNPVLDEGALPEPRVTAMELLRRATKETGMQGTERIAYPDAPPDRSSSGRPSRDPSARWWGPAVAMAVLALVVVAAGMLTLITRIDDGAATEPSPSTPTTLASVLDEAPARVAGAPYDPAVHDLCAWFEPAEVGEIVAAGYDDAGATPLPSPFVAGEPPAFPPIACSWSSQGVVPDAPDWDGSGFYTVMLSVEGDVYTGDPQVSSLVGGEILVKSEERQGYLEERTKSDFVPMADLSDEVALIGAVVRDAYAWSPPGAPARWQSATVRVRVAGHPDVYLTTSVISDPPVSFVTGPVPDRTVDVALSVVQDLLERMNWIEE